MIEGFKKKRILYSLCALFCVVVSLLFVAYPDLDYSDENQIILSSETSVQRIVPTVVKVIGTVVGGDESSPLPISGISVELRSVEKKFTAEGVITEGTLISSTSTDENGLFVFEELSDENNYEIVPVSSDYRFSTKEYFLSSSVIKEHLSETSAPFEEIYFDGLSVQKLSDDLRNLNNEITSSGANLRANVSGDAPSLEAVLIERKDLMLKAAELEPAEFFNNTLTAEARSSLPVDLQKYVETKQVLTGEVNVFITEAGDGSPVHKTSYLFNQGKNLKLFNVEEYKVGPGVNLSVDGYLIDQNVVAVSSTRSVSKTVATSRFKTEGSFKGRIIRVRSGTPLPASATITDTEWNTVFAEVENAYDAESYGKYNIDLELGEILNLDSLPTAQPGQEDSDWYLSLLNFSSCAELSKISETDKLIFVLELGFPGMSQGRATTGIGDSIVSYNNHCAPEGEQVVTRSIGVIVLFVDRELLTPVPYKHSRFFQLIAHELGHTLGFMHAGDPSTEKSDYTGNGSDLTGVGNDFDIMGQGFFSSYFGALYKLAARWILPTDLTIINNTNRYELNPLESNFGKRIARVTTGSGINFYLEFREPDGPDGLIQERFHGLYIVVPKALDFSIPPEEEKHFGLEPIPGGTILLPASKEEYASTSNPVLRSGDCIVIGDRKISIPADGINDGQRNISFDVEFLSLENPETSLEIGECGISYELDTEIDENLLWGSPTNEISITAKNLGDIEGDEFPVEIRVIRLGSNDSEEEVFKELITADGLKPREKKVIFSNNFDQLNYGNYKIIAELDPSNEENNKSLSNREIEKTFEIDAASLYISHGIDIAGKVVSKSNPSAEKEIDCSSDDQDLSACRGDFRVGAAVTLTASYDTSTTKLIGWEIDEEGIGDVPLSCGTATGNNCNFTIKNKTIDRIAPVFEKCGAGTSSASLLFGESTAPCGVTTLPTADLVASAPYLYPDGENGNAMEFPIEGEKVTLKGFLTVLDASVPATQARFEIRDLGGNIIFTSTVSVPATSPTLGKLLTAPQKWTAKEEGYYSLKVCVDSTNVVNEGKDPVGNSLESNNCLTKQFEVNPSVLVKVERSPSTVGTITASGYRLLPGINCPSGACQMRVPKNNQVTLSAGSASSYLFAGWYDQKCQPNYGSTSCTAYADSNITFHPVYLNVGLYWGDVDRDGTVTTTDALSAWHGMLDPNWLINKYGWVGYALADVDRRGFVQATDVNSILRMSQYFNSSGSYRSALPETELKQIEEVKNTFVKLKDLKLPGLAKIQVTEEGNQTRSLGSAGGVTTDPTTSIYAKRPYGSGEVESLSTAEYQQLGKLQFDASSISLTGRMAIWDGSESNLPSYAYLASNRGVQIVRINSISSLDIRPNLSYPAEFGCGSRIVNDCSDFADEKWRTIRDIAVSGNSLYVLGEESSGKDRLWYYDLAVPNNPKLISNTDLNYLIKGIAPLALTAVGDTIFVVGSDVSTTSKKNSVMYVLKTKYPNPSNTAYDVILGKVQFNFGQTEYPKKMEVAFYRKSTEKQYAFVSADDLGVVSIDVTSLSGMTPLGKISGVKSPALLVYQGAQKNFLLYNKGEQIGVSDISAEQISFNKNIKFPSDLISFVGSTAVGSNSLNQIWSEDGDSLYLAGTEPSVGAKYLGGGYLPDYTNDSIAGYLFLVKDDSSLEVKSEVGANLSPAIQAEYCDVDCGDIDMISGDKNRTAVLMAKPAEGKTFSRWQGASECDGSTNDTCLIKLENNKEISACFLDSNNVETCPIIYGDLNKDGKIGLADGMKVIKIAKGEEGIPTGEDFAIVDVDKSGKIDATDGLFILKSMIRKVKLPYLTYMDKKLNIKVEGEGSLAFSSTDSELAQVLSLCEGRCEGDLRIPDTATVQITATAKEGFTFVGFEGACSGVETCQVVVDKPQEVKAVFESKFKTDFSVLEITPSRFKVGKRARFKAKLRNYGDEIVGASVVEVRVDEDNDGSWDREYREVQRVSEYRASESKTFKLKIRDRANFWTPAKDGNYRYQFCAYVDGVRDYDPADNCMEYMFTLSDGSSRSLKKLSKKIKKKKLVTKTVTPITPVTTTTSTTSTTTTVIKSPVSTAIPVTSTTTSTTTTTLPPVSVTTTTMMQTTTTTTLP